MEGAEDESGCEASRIGLGEIVSVEELRGDRVDSLMVVGKEDAKGCGESEVLLDDGEWVGEEFKGDKCPLFLTELSS